VKRRVSNSLPEFGKNMDKLSQEISKGMDEVYRRAFLSVGKTVVNATPFDTHRAKGNWQPSLSRPITRPRVNTFGAGASIGDMKRIASILKHPITAYISNNLDYIGLLNGGSSQQAPAGFVQISVNAGLRSIRDARVLGRRVSVSVSQR